ncbi:biopolymer transporter ExbD [Allohahella marinimesophila]|uniref:Biopolymer transport protein ExbD n=1 Tax=Allohahella marinimesophila TaxID=1054972 RepID=A0ABP7NMX5_9GAMM
MKKTSLQLLTRRSKPTEDNMIPLINIVFLLLIFFMIAGTIARAPDADIDLPVTSLSQQQSESDTFHLSLTADERFYRDGTEISFDDLSKQVKQLDKQGTSLVSISADKGLQVPKLYAVLSLFNDVEGVSVSLRTLSEPEPVSPVASKL